MDIDNFFITIGVISPYKFQENHFFPLIKLINNINLKKFLLCKNFYNKINKNLIDDKEEVKKFRQNHTDVGTILIYD